LYNCIRASGSGAHYLMSHVLVSNALTGPPTGVHSATPIVLNKQS